MEMNLLFIPYSTIPVKNGHYYSQHSKGIAENNGNMTEWREIFFCPHIEKTKSFILSSGWRLLYDNPSLGYKRMMERYFRSDSGNYFFKVFSGTFYLV